MAKFGKYSSIHTILNKLTGLAIFTVPYIMLYKRDNMIYSIICILALTSAVEELIIHIKSPKFNPDISSLLKINR